MKFLLTQFMVLTLSCLAYGQGYRQENWNSTDANKKIAFNESQMDCSKIEKEALKQSISRKTLRQWRDRKKKS